MEILTQVAYVAKQIFKALPSRKKFLNNSGITVYYVKVE